jgi:hypothetical protein
MRLTPDDTPAICTATVIAMTLVMTLSLWHLWDPTSIWCETTWRVLDDIAIGTGYAVIILGIISLIVHLWLYWRHR